MSGDPSTAPRPWLLAVAGIYVLLIAARLLGPSDIYDNAQPRTIAYTVDVAVNDEWLMQHDARGLLTTKPPLYQWLAGLGVKATGLTTEFMFKLPSLVAFLACGLLIWDMARRLVEPRAALIAPVAWAANYHVFKLMYTARPDMLMTAFITLALWSLLRQRERAGRDSVGLIFLFWLAVAGAALAKGPAALLPVGFGIILVTVDRGWKRCRIGWQLLGLACALSIFGVWLALALATYPQWLETINAEVVDRVTGHGDGANRNTPLGAMPLYFLTRFFPWSILCVVAALTWKRLGSRAATWTLWWIALVLIVFMIPRGKRSDYILPAYAGASVLVAVLLSRAALWRGPMGQWVAILLGALGVGGIVVFIGAWLAPRPEPIEGIVDVGRAVILIGGFVALAGGAASLALHHVEQVRGKMIAGAYVIVGALAIYQSAYSRAAESRSGDHIHAVTQTIRALSDGESLDVSFYEVHRTTIPALLGVNRPVNDAELDRAERGGLLVIPEREWQQHSQRFPDARIVADTPLLRETESPVLVVRTAP